MWAVCKPGSVAGCLAIAALTASGGCTAWNRLWNKPPPKPDPIPPTTQIAVEQPLTVVSPELPVKSGSLPLAYLLEHPGEIRVIDATDGTVVASTLAGGRTILSVDAERGVAIAGKVIRAGPLDPGHTYEIYLTNPQRQNISRNVYERR